MSKVCVMVLALLFSMGFNVVVTSDSVGIDDYEEATTGKKGEWIHIIGHSEKTSYTESVENIDLPIIFTNILFMENTYIPRTIYFEAYFSATDWANFEPELGTLETVVFIYSKYDEQTFTVLEVTNTDSSVVRDGSLIRKNLWIDPTRQFLEDIMKAKEYRIRLVGEHGQFIESLFRDYSSHEALTSRYYSRY